MSQADAKPLPFIYQFGAGAVAGVSEVCLRRQLNSQEPADVWMIDPDYVPLGRRKDESVRHTLVEMVGNSLTGC